MLEFVVVDHAEGFPQKCVSCDSQVGPFVLTHRQLNPWGTVYVCKRCSKTCARLFGFAPGKRLDVLENASTELETAQKEVATYRARLAKSLDESELWIARWESATDELKQRDGRIAQLEERLRERAQSDLALTT